MLLAAVLLTSCGEDVMTGAVDVKWDRDSCERCKMMLSDRHYATEVRYMANDRQSRIYKFDDIGCAVIWLENKLWRDDVTTELWVTDHTSGKWIDAKQAFYLKGRMSPMGYGLAAQLDSSDITLDFSAARQHILETEKKLQQHSPAGHVH